MKKAWIPLLLVAILVALVAFSAAYMVREYEQVIVVRFGEVLYTVDEPGLHFKVPWLDEARRYEKRWLEWDGEPSQITTLDKRYVYIDVFARWRIAKPRTFIEVLRDETTAQGRLDDIIDSATRNVVANHNLIEAIRSSNRKFFESDEERLLTMDQDIESPDASDGSNPEVEAPPEGEAPEARSDNAAPVKSLYAITVGRESLTRLILEKASAKAAQLGIEIKDVQIKRINYIESVQAKVYDRMISERKRVAEAFRSQGRGKSAEILGRTDKELKKIRSEAFRLAEEIKGKADAEAASIYADAYKRDPEFYNFLKTLESYGKTIDENSWLVLSTDADYARRFSTMRKGLP